jgi:RNA polymerase subunit RPABC4/transcription elongation factor Spt4
MDFLGQIGAAIGGFLANPYLHLLVQAVGVYVVILWLAASYWAFRDMQLRTQNPILPYLASAFIIVSSPLLFWASIIVYRIIRPQEKIGEVYERNLAEEALLAEVEAVKSCPTCSRRINDEWIICPTCRTRLNRVCPNCSRLVGLDWSLCAWCGKDFERPATAIAASAGRPAQITPLPGGMDETGRIGRGATETGAYGEDDLATKSRAVARPERRSSPRASSPRSAPDVLPES